MRHKIFKIVKNKYILASLAFIVWAGFIDSDHNYFRQVRLKKDLQEMVCLKTYYEEQVEKNKTLAYNLETNIEYVEKYAREEFGMKRDNEVVYELIPE